MEKKREFRFVVNKAYTIPGRGVVVTGKVEKGSIAVGDEIGLIGADGQYAGATVTAIEVSRRLVEATEAGQEASLLLEGIRKNQIVQGAVLMESQGTAPASVGPSYSEEMAPSRSDTASYSPGYHYEPPSTEPITPSSGMGRTVGYVLIGLLILLALLFLQGKPDLEKWDPRKWDPKKLDPRKWAPEKKKTSIERPVAGLSLPLTGLSFPDPLRTEGEGGEKTAG